MYAGGSRSCSFALTIAARISFSNRLPRYVSGSKASNNANTFVSTTAKRRVAPSRVWYAILCYAPWCRLQMTVRAQKNGDKGSGPVAVGIMPAAVATAVHGHLELSSVQQLQRA